MQAYRFVYKFCWTLFLLSKLCCHSVESSLVDRHTTSQRLPTSLLLLWYECVFDICRKTY